MKATPEKLIKLFLSTLKLSACTFGGGFVIVPLMRKRFVQELGWIDEEEMLDLIAIAQSSPGAIAVNSAIIVGYNVGGIAGAIASAIGTVLPPLVIISIISLFYKEFRDNVYVGYVMHGMLAGVAAVITDVVISMGTDIAKKKKLLPILIMAGAFAAVYFFGISVIFVILFCIVLGSVYSVVNRQKGGKPNEAA